MGEQVMQVSPEGRKGSWDLNQQKNGVDVFITVPRTVGADYTLAELIHLYWLRKGSPGQRAATWRKWDIGQLFQREYLKWVKAARACGKAIFNGFIEIRFTCYTFHPFKVHHSIAFNEVKDTCSHPSIITADLGTTSSPQEEILYDPRPLSLSTKQT